jgi:hypothetical protein
LKRHKRGEEKVKIDCLKWFMRRQKRTKKKSIEVKEKKLVPFSMDTDGLEND